MPNGLQGHSFQYKVFQTLVKKLRPILTMAVFLTATIAIGADQPADTFSFNMPSSDADVIAPALKIVGLLTILSIAPAILLMMTSFTRILIVLSFTRLALGTQTMPPNQVMIGLALFLTFFTMEPVIDHVKEHSITPYFDKEISGEVAFDQAMIPVRKFMLSQTREADLGLFYQISEKQRPATVADIPNSVLFPAFLVSELKTAFNIGFLIYIPFLIIDMVVSSILMAMGMMMLPPTVVSLPFKLVLFVLIDGWSILVESLVSSFNNVT